MNVNTEKQELLDQIGPCGAQIAQIGEPLSIAQRPSVLQEATTNSNGLALELQSGKSPETCLSKAQSPALPDNPAILALEPTQSLITANTLVWDSTDSLAEVRLSSGKQTSGSSLKRKKAIQERLLSSIAAGEMPPYCRNCGEISTPTCLLYTSPSPRDGLLSRMPSSA